MVRIKEKGKVGDDKILYCQYYNTDIYPNGPPKQERDYEFSTCAEMNPDSDEYGEWTDWELIPDSRLIRLSPVCQWREVKILLLLIGLMHQNGRGMLS